jgi:hypothetical protein
MGVSGDRGTMIAVFEISQQIPSDCLQPNPLLSLSAKNNQERLEHKTFTKNPDLGHSVRK